MHAGKAPPIGDNQNYTLEIPVGFRIVYSLERQPPGLCHHLSVSVTGGLLYPGPPAVEQIMNELGFNPGGLRRAYIWVERDVRAVNVIQPVDPEWQPELYQPEGKDQD